MLETGLPSSSPFSCTATSLRAKYPTLTRLPLLASAHPAASPPARSTRRKPDPVLATRASAGWAE